jgi:serine/threonine-protein kinase
MPDSSVFRDLRCLGEGAQGKAVLVEHVETGERMCVKRISVASSKAAEQAEQEVAILSRLSHPSLTKIFGAWHEEHAHARSLAILMEFADGGCLSDVIRARNSPFDEAIVMEYVVQTAAALAYMHRQSVIHRGARGRAALRPRARRMPPSLTRRLACASQISRRPTSS